MKRCGLARYEIMDPILARAARDAMGHFGLFPARGARNGTPLRGLMAVVLVPLLASLPDYPNERWDPWTCFVVFVAMDPSVRWGGGTLSAAHTQISGQGEPFRFC